MRKWKWKWIGIAVAVATLMRTWARVRGWLNGAPSFTSV